MASMLASLRDRHEITFLNVIFTDPWIRLLKSSTAMTELSNKSTQAAVLGGSGLIPFVTLALASGLVAGSLSHSANFAFVVYAGVILSFLGGIQWGLAMGGRNAGTLTEEEFGMLLTMSVVPSLIAWGGVYAWNSLWGVLLLATGYFLALAVDHWSYGKALIPRWFYVMRFVLTCVVVLCLSFVAIGNSISA